MLFHKFKDLLKSDSCYTLHFMLSIVTTSTKSHLTEEAIIKRLLIKLFSRVNDPTQPKPLRILSLRWLKHLFSIQKYQSISFNPLDLLFPIERFPLALKTEIL